MNNFYELFGYLLCIDASRYVNNANNFPVEVQCNYVIYIESQTEDYAVQVKINIL